MSKKQILLIILVLVIIIRAILAFLMWRNFGLEGFYEIDSLSCYVNTAKALVFEKAFMSSGIPDIVRTPGYPIFLIPGVILGQLEFFAITMNIILSCLSCYFIYRIAINIFKSEKVALFASFLYAFEPVSILSCVKIMPETLCACLTLCFSYLFILYFKKRKLRLLLFSALVLAGAVYTRPVNYFLPIYLALIISFYSVFKNRTRAMQDIAPMVIFVLLSIILVLPWQIRNKIKTGYGGFSAYGDVTLFIHQLSSMVSMEEGIPYLKAQEKLFVRLSEDLKINPLDVNCWAKKDIYEYMFQQAQEKVSNNPLLYFRLYLSQMVLFFIGPRPKEMMNIFIPISYCSETTQNRYNDSHKFSDEFKVCSKAAWIYWPCVAGILISLFYFILAISAFWLKRIKFDIFTLILLSIIFYAIIFPKGGLLVPTRYRLPIMPGICIFAACIFLPNSYRKESQQA